MRTGLAVLCATCFAVAPAKADYLAPPPGGSTAVANVWSAQQGFSTNATPSASDPNGATTGVPLWLQGADGGGATVPIYAYGGTPQIASRRYNGTISAPTAVTSGVQIGNYFAQGYNGTGFSPASGLICQSREAFTTTAEGTLCKLQVTALGGTSSVAALSVTDTTATFSGNLLLATGLGISAAGTTLATATALTKDINEVTTVASGTGVVLAAFNTSVQRQEVINAGANALNVYPPTTGAAIRNLNGSTTAGTAGAAVSLAVGTHATFECVSTTLCYMGP